MRFTEVMMYFHSNTNSMILLKFFTLKHCAMTLPNILAVMNFFCLVPSLVGIEKHNKKRHKTKKIKLN